MTAGPAAWPYRALHPPGGPTASSPAGPFTALLGAAAPATDAVPASDDLHALARRRFRARFPAGTPAWSAAALDAPAPRELTICPEGLLSFRDLLPALAAARQRLPQAVVRIESWWALGGVPDLDAAALTTVRGDPAAAVPYIHGLFTHADELSPPVRGQIAACAAAGLPLAAEVLLARGRNDSVETLRALLRLLEEQRVRPYFLVAPEWLEPERRVPAAAALELVRGLRGWISGLAVPQLVRETATGERELRIPPYLARLDEEGAELTDYRGQRRTYPNPSHSKG